MHDFLNELSAAASAYRRSPGVLIIAVLSIAIAIGVNCAVFSYVDALYLRPIVANASEIWTLVNQRPGQMNGQISMPDFRDISARSSQFASLVAESRDGSRLTIAGVDQFHLTSFVTPNYFEAMDIRFVRGAWSDLIWDAKSGGVPPIAISYTMWQRRFGGRPNIIGASAEVNRNPVRIAAVVTPAFRGVIRGVATEVWIPITSYEAFAGGPARLANRSDSRYDVYARVRSGNVSAARAELAALADHLSEAYPDVRKEWTLSLVPAEGLRAHPRNGILLLLISAAVLLIACANVAALLLVQAERRRREVGIRIALGASRRRLVRQFLLESAVLSIAGGALGVLIGRWVMFSIAALTPPGPIDRALDTRIDERFFAFTVVMTAISTFVFGLIPARQLAKVELLSSLRGESGFGAGRNTRWRTALASAEVALAVTLVACSVMLVRNFLYAATLDPGFDTQKQALLFTGSFRTLPPGTTGGEVLQEAADRLLEVPGIKNVTYARRLFLSGSGGDAALTVRIPGIELPGGSVGMKYDQVGPSYFSMMNVPVLLGRGLDARDADANAATVVVNDYLARQYWPNANALGQTLQINDKQAKIVGITSNPRINELSEQPEPVLILPYAAWPSGDFTLIVETNGPPDTIGKTAESQIAKIAGDRFGVGRPKTMSAFMLEVLEDERRLAYVGSCMASVGMSLAALGLYSMMLWVARRRMREFGIRMAVGGSQRHIFGLVARQALNVGLIGVPIGLLTAFAAMRGLSSLVYGVNPGDPMSIITAVLVVGVVVLAAGYSPARKAAHANPLEILRYD